MALRLKCPLIHTFSANPSGCAVQGFSLLPLACWDGGLESRRGHGVCVLSSRGTWVGLITRPEESCWAWCCLIECDREAWMTRRPWLTRDCSAKRGGDSLIRQFPDFLLLDLASYMMDRHIFRLHSQRRYFCYFHHFPSYGVPSCFCCTWPFGLTDSFIILTFSLRKIAVHFA
jgi:hypothetical protein